jgi:hypothetical protein
MAVARVLVARSLSRLGTAKLSGVEIEAIVDANSVPCSRLLSILGLSAQQIDELRDQGVLSRPMPSSA